LFRRRTFLKHSATATAFAWALTAAGHHFGGLFLSEPGSPSESASGSANLKS